MSVLCVIQARMGSRRLPGKMLLPINGVPLIEIAWRKACEAFGKENVVVAVPGGQSNGALVDAVLALGGRVLSCLGYDENDVIGRFNACAHHYGRALTTDLIFRYTPDDWRKDVAAMRQVVEEAGKLKYQSVATWKEVPSTIPVEIGGECFPLELYGAVNALVKDPHMREHISIPLNTLARSWYGKRPPPAPPDDGLPWSIDTEDDLRRANA